eukprot:Pgem_evm1s550
MKSPGMFNIRRDQILTSLTRDRPKLEHRRPSNPKLNILGLEEGEATVNKSPQDDILSRNIGIRASSEEIAELKSYAVNPFSDSKQNLSKLNNKENDDNFVMLPVTTFPDILCADNSSYCTKSRTSSFLSTRLKLESDIVKEDYSSVLCFPDVVGFSRQLTTTSSS